MLVKHVAARAWRGNDKNRSVELRLQKLLDQSVFCELRDRARYRNLRQLALVRQLFGSDHDFFWRLENLTQNAMVELKVRAKRSGRVQLLQPPIDELRRAARHYVEAVPPHR